MSIDVITQWPELLPSKLLDKRSVLPKHSIFRWKKRDVSDITGMCIHQTLGNDNPVNTAHYHIKHFPNGSDTPGAPGVAYTFYIRKNGDIWWCNDIEDKTWSQGTSKLVGDENKYLISAVVGGHFDGQGYSKSGIKEHPTLEQMLSLLELIRWLSFNLGFGSENVLCHADLSKPACPGFDLQYLVNVVKEDVYVGLGNMRWSNKDWQYALIRLGYDLGRYGQNKDGVDGVWGSSSRTALSKFQSKYGVSSNGTKDAITKTTLIHALESTYGKNVDFFYDK